MKKAWILLLLSALCGCGAQGGYRSIDHFYIEEEGDAFRQAYNELVTDTYEWYKSIEGEDGVYIIHCDHFAQEIMQEWKKSGYRHAVPDSDLDYYVASVSYLEDRGLALREEDRQMVKDGVRLYLLPDTLSEEETGTMKRFLSEDALYGLDQGSLIDTVFAHSRKIEFRTYHFEGTFEVPGGDPIENPVIFAAGCQNMKYFEAESLIATGKTDGYIRLTEDAFRKYAGDHLPQELKDRKVTFLPESRLTN